MANSTLENAIDKRCDRTETTETDLWELAEGYLSPLVGDDSSPSCRTEGVPVGTPRFEWTNKGDSK